MTNDAIKSEHTLAFISKAARGLLIQAEPDRVLSSRCCYRRRRGTPHSFRRFLNAGEAAEGGGGGKGIKKLASVADNAVKFVSISHVVW